MVSARETSSCLPFSLCRGIRGIITCISKFLRDKFSPYKKLFLSFSKYLLCLIKCKKSIKDIMEKIQKCSLLSRITNVFFKVLERVKIRI